jgi:prepilin signal peptidase PulO-like enzyme (type II secretory pathway)
VTSGHFSWVARASRWLTVQASIGFLLPVVVAVPLVVAGTVAVTGNLSQLLAGAVGLLGAVVGV